MKKQIEKREIPEMANVMMGHCEIDNQCGSCHWSTCNECLAEVLYKAGYRKQKEGEWLEHGEIGAMNNAWECSVCHWKTVSFTEMKHSKFCPNCGAKMKGARNE